MFNRRSFVKLAALLGLAGPLPLLSRVRAEEPESFEAMFEREAREHLAWVRPMPRQAEFRVFHAGIGLHRSVDYGVFKVMRRGKPHYTWVDWRAGKIAAYDYVYVPGSVNDGIARYYAAAFEKGGRT